MGLTRLWSSPSAAGLRARIAPTGNRVELWQEHSGQDRGSEVLAVDIDAFRAFIEEIRAGGLHRPED